MNGVEKRINEELRGLTKPADFLKKKMEILNRKNNFKGEEVERKVYGEISESLMLDILLTEIETRLEAKNANKK